MRQECRVGEEMTGTSGQIEELASAAMFGAMAERGWDNTEVTTTWKGHRLSVIHAEICARVRGVGDVNEDRLEQLAREAAERVLNECDGQV